MLINTRQVKSRIKEAGLRSNKETVLAIDKKVDGMISAIILKNQVNSKRTLKAEDIL